MKRTLFTTLLIVAGFLCVAGAAQAQSARQTEMAASVDPMLSDCTYNFGGGVLTWCVSANGNVMKFESPAGSEHIRVGYFGEGYVLCEGTTAYYDLGGGQAGFGAPVVVASSGTAVTLRRTTTDGRFTLEQKFFADKNERDITIQATVTRNIVASGNHIRLARYADFDVDGAFTNARFDKSLRTVWANDLSGGQNAVTLSGITIKGSLPITATAASFCCFSVPPAPDPCAPAAAAVPSVGDYSAWVVYDLGTPGAGKKTIVKFTYRAQ